MSQRIACYTLFDITNTNVLNRSIFENWANESCVHVLHISIVKQWSESDKHPQPSSSLHSYILNHSSQGQVLVKQVTNQLYSRLSIHKSSVKHDSRKRKAEIEPVCSELEMRVKCVLEGSNVVLLSSPHCKRDARSALFVSTM